MAHRQDFNKRQRVRKRSKSNNKKSGSIARWLAQIEDPRPHATEIGTGCNGFGRQTNFGLVAIFGIKTTTASIKQHIAICRVEHKHPGRD